MQRRSRGRKRIKVLVGTLVGILVVVGIVAGIRLATKNSNSDASTGTGTTQPSTAARHQPPKPPPIDAAQLAKYEGYAAGLQTANRTATKGFLAAGTTPTQAQVATVVTSYRTALNLYDFQLHFIQWPASMQTEIATDHSQLQNLMSFLQSFSSISPTGVGAWLSQLHNRTSTTETADNLVRNDLGLSSSSTWP